MKSTMAKQMFYFVFLALFLTSFAETNKIKVSVYYEHLCPNSILFMATQLKPTHAKLGDYIDLDLVPYGKATHTMVDGKWQFECQHGNAECRGNKMQVCVLNQNLPASVNVNFFSCVMASLTPTADWKMQKCAEQHGVSWEEVEQCRASGLGDELLAQYGDRTHSFEPKITWVPTIVFNDKFDMDVLLGSQFQFFDTLCAAFEEKPEACL